MCRRSDTFDTVYQGSGPLDASWMPPSAMCRTWCELSCGAGLSNASLPLSAPIVGWSFGISVNDFITRNGDVVPLMLFVLTAWIVARIAVILFCRYVSRHSSQCNASQSQGRAMVRLTTAGVDIRSSPLCSFSCPQSCRQCFCGCTWT